MNIQNIILNIRQQIKVFKKNTHTKMEGRENKVNIEE